MSKSRPGAVPRLVRVRFPRWIPLVAPLVLSFGCSSEPDAMGGADPVAVTDSVAGVARLTWPDRPFPELHWRLDTVAVIGGFGGEESSVQFDQVEAGGIAGAADGRLFLLDAAGKRVLGFGTGGEPIGVWGRDGSGPGELNTPAGLAVGPADSIWVADRGNRRITLFPPDPAGVTSEIALNDESSGLGGRLLAGGDGVIGVAMIFSFRPGEEVQYPPRTLLRILRDGTIADTVWTAPPPAFDRIELTSGNQVAIMLSQRFFSPGFYWDRFADGGFAVAQQADYEISLLVADGSERLRIRRNPPARPATESDRERAREQARDQAEDSGSPFVRQSVEERIEKMTFAERIPRITGLAVDAADRLWVGVSVDRPGETDRIDVYDREGSPIGELRNPSFFPTRFFGEDRAAFLDRDELDVQRVVVLRLVEDEVP